MAESKQKSYTNACVAKPQLPSESLNLTNIAKIKLLVKCKYILFYIFH